MCRQLRFQGVGDDEAVRAGDASQGRFEHAEGARKVSYEITLVLGVMLVGVTFVALLVRKLVWSLILLFYASIVFGALLIAYRAAFAGLFHIITFSGAVSVLFMVILMIVGAEAWEYPDKLGKDNLVGMILAILAAIPLVLLVSN